MDCPALPQLFQLACPRQPLAAWRQCVCRWGGAGLALLGLACASGALAQSAPPTPAAQGSTGSGGSLPPAEPPSLPAAAEKDMPTPAQEVKPLPINLDTVLRLAEGQNTQIAIARARIREACAEKAVASYSWLPSLNVGTTYYRHEGGNVLDGNGTFTHSSFGTLFGGADLYAHLDLKEAVFQQVNAERKVRQQQAELSRVSSETLLDASATYIDLLAARTGEAIARSLEKDLQDLLGRAEKLASAEPGARIQVASVQAQIRGVQRSSADLREQANRAAAKLAYVLGLDPCAIELIPVDEQLVPFDLVDVTPPVCDLVAQALRTGPGIREMERLLALIDQSMARARGPGRYIPIFEARALEGAFGTGPGDDMRWDNRFDFAVQVRWNLTELVTACDRQRVFQAQAAQARLAYQDLRGKLTAGVQEAREVIVSGRDQIRLAQDQIRAAREFHDLSEQRYRNQVPGSSYSEVLLSLQTLASAQGNYVNVLRDYDKAQLRLLVLLGAVNGHAAHGNCPGGKP